MKVIGLQLSFPTTSLSAFIIAKYLLFFLPPGNMKEFFSSTYCENLVKLLEENSTKVSESFTLLSSIFVLYKYSLTWFLSTVNLLGHDLVSVEFCFSAQLGGMCNMTLGLILHTSKTELFLEVYLR